MHPEKFRRIGPASLHLPTSLLDVAITCIWVLFNFLFELPSGVQKRCSLRRPLPLRNASVSVVYFVGEPRSPVCRDDKGSAGHGSSGSANLSGSRGSRASTRDPLTRDQVDKIPRTGYFVAVMMFDFESTSTWWSWLETAIVGSHDSWVVLSHGSRGSQVTCMLYAASLSSFYFVYCIISVCCLMA